MPKKTLISNLFVVFLVVFFLDTTAHSQRIIMLETMRAPIIKQFSESFLAQIALLESYGKRVQIERLNGDGSQEKVMQLLNEAMVRKPDIVVSVATMASVVVRNKLAESSIPQIFMCVTDPVGSGLVKNIGAPSSTNITGKVHYISAKTKLEMVDQIIRKKHGNGTARFGYIHTDYPADLSDLQRLLEESRNRSDIEFLPYKIKYKELPKYSADLLGQLKEAVLHLNEKVDYFWAPRGALAVLPAHDKTILQYGQKPFLVGATEESVALGAMLHITADPISQGEDAAIMAMRILDGEDPGTIPVTLPKVIQFAVNLTTAKELQLVVPSGLLELAQDNVYY